MTFAILITRPQPAASKFAARVRARLGPDTPVVVSPLMRRVCVPGALPDLSGYTALVLTSAEAVPALADRTEARNLRCYCVGEATAEAARRAGLAAIDGGGTAERMLARLRTNAPQGRLLYLRGVHVARDLAQELTAAGLPTDEAIVYRQEAQALSAEAGELLAGAAPVILPLFSPRSARLFFACAPGKAPLFVAAISANAAAEVPGERIARLAVAQTATGDALLDTVEALASQAKRVESGQGAN